MRLTMLLALISGLIACGDAPQSNEIQRTTLGVRKSISSVSQNTFTWESGSSLKMNKEIIYASRMAKDYAGVLSARFFVIEDLSEFQGELKCQGKCVIVSRTAPSDLTCKLTGSFRYEHVTDSATLPSTVLMQVQKAFEKSSESRKPAPTPKDYEEKQHDYLENQFNRTFNEVKAKFDRIRADSKQKFQLDTDAQVTYEGEAVKLDGKLQANGPGKITLKDGTWIMTEFSAGKDAVTSDSIFADIKENFVCAGPMTTSFRNNSWKLDMTTGTICLRNGKYEKQ